MPNSDDGSGIQSKLVIWPWSLRRRVMIEPVEAPPKKVEPVWDPHQPLPAHLTTAQILAATPPTKPRRTRTRETSKSLGVYDADKDILDQYLYEVSMTPLLTPQQEIAIAKRVRAGDPEAMQELVKRNLRFVISVAKKYQSRRCPRDQIITLMLEPPPTTLPIDIGIARPLT